MSRKTRKDVSDMVDKLNGALLFRDAPYRYQSHSENGYMVLEKHSANGGCIESTVRGVSTGEMYRIVKATWDILTDNTFARNQ